jgi:hypothetical protein
MFDLRLIKKCPFLNSPVGKQILRTMMGEKTLPDAMLLSYAEECPVMSEELSKLRQETEISVLQCQNKELYEY